VTFTDSRIRCQREVIKVVLLGYQPATRKTQPVRGSCVYTLQQTDDGLDVR
jgi:hypothetical protein